MERRPFNTLAQIRWTVSGRCLCCPALPCLFFFLSNTVSSNAGDRTWARIASARGASPDDNDVTPSGQSIELGQYPDTPATTARQSHATLPPTQLTDPGSEFPPYHRTDHREGHPQKSTPRDKPVIIKYWIEALRRHPHRHQTSGSADKMKFSHSIQFNAVPDWSAYYLAYSNLKKLYVYPLCLSLLSSAGGIFFLYCECHITLRECMLHWRKFSLLNGSL